MSRTPAAPHPEKQRDGAANLVAVASFRRGGSGPGNARGAVTAEFAVALPAVLLLLAMLLAGAAGGMTQLRLEEAARAGARALARGEDPAAIEAVVRTLAGASATATVAVDGEWLSVTVADRVGGPLGASVPWTLTAKATTRSEIPAASGVLQPPAALQPALSQPAALQPALSQPAALQPALSQPASTRAVSLRSLVASSVLLLREET